MIPLQLAQQFNKYICVILLAGCAGDDPQIEQELEDMMARDASGNYTLPAGNPVVSGTVIETNWANPTMADIGNETTDSLSRTGKGGMLSQLKCISGTVGNPGVSFLDQLNLGFYRAATNDMRAAVNGSDVQRWIDGKIQVWDGAQWVDVLIGSDAVIDGPNPTLADETAALVTGTNDPVNDPHIAYGISRIQGKSTSTVAANLDINILGGDVNLGPQSGVGDVSMFKDAARVVETIVNGVRIGSFGGLSMEMSGNTINAENGGAPSDLLLNPGGFSVELYQGASKVAETAAATSGGFFINNTFTGIGIERATTESDKWSSLIDVTASRNLAFSDVGGYLIRDAAGNFTLTMVTSLTLPSQANAEIIIDNIDDVHSGTITIAAGAATIRIDSGGSLVLNAGETGYLKQIATDVWRFKK